MSNLPIRAITKPVIIEAFLWEGGPEKATPIINWILENGGTAHWDEEHREVLAAEDGKVTEWGSLIPESIYINTLEGTMRADIGDWIIRGTRGEFYPCKPGPFADKYEF